MAYKPNKTLTQLEEEPEAGFMGCTHTEITIAMRKGLFVGIVTTLVLSMLIRWEIAAVAALVIAVVTFIVIAQLSASNRADKPLYYHLHLKIHKSKRMIQPPTQYQIERNTNECKK